MASLGPRNKPRVPIHPSDRDPALSAPAIQAAIPRNRQGVSPQHVASNSNLRCAGDLGILAPIELQE